MYLDGSPLRKIGHRYNISPMTAFRKCRSMLTRLPENDSITYQYCDMRKFSGVLIIDGKYIAVKGYKRKIPLIWSIDYATHDIPHFILAQSEDYSAALDYFRKLRKMGYRLHYLVCDDNPAFKMAAKHVYPDVVVQMCLNHYKESIRRKLGIKVSVKYRPFFFEVEQLFADRLDPNQFSYAIEELNRRYDDDVRCRYWLEDLRYLSEE